MKWWWLGSMQDKWHCRRDGHSCANKPPLQSERFHKKTMVAWWYCAWPLIGIIARRNAPAVKTNGRAWRPFVVALATGLIEQTEQFVAGHGAAFRINAGAVFQRAGGEAAFADHHAVRNADQFHVGEHRTGAQAAVVQHGLDAACGEFLVERFGGGGDLRIALRIDHADRHAPRRHRLRPDDAGLVVALLDRGRHDAADADAVAAHQHHLGLALVVAHGGAQRLGVLGAELEYMAHLDAAGEVQHALAVGRGVALDHLTDVLDAGDARIALPVGAVWWVPSRL